MKLNICHLYPDVLNLYGDTGNITCLRQRILWRGIGVEITQLPIGAQADFSRFDLFFIGGGQSFEQGLIMDDLRSGKADEIKAAVEDEKVVLAVCGGYQILGRFFRTHSGEQFDFIGAIDIHTIGSDERMIGNYMFSCAEDSGGATIVGFENHSGKTYLGEGVSPLGKVMTGFGNNGEDGTEGARYKNVFGTYCHGPLLPKNPKFADFIIKTALERRYPNAELVMETLDDSLELKAHHYMQNRLK